MPLVFFTFSRVPRLHSVSTLDRYFLCSPPDPLLTAASRSPRVPVCVSALSVQHVSCGQSHTLITATSGQVWATGYDRYGQVSRSDKGSKEVCVGGCGCVRVYGSEGAGVRA
eukprot:723370-Prorocentrum_minimum.AAC.1